jgi:hypothetical protein
LITNGINTSWEKRFFEWKNFLKGGEEGNCKYFIMIGDSGNPEKYHKGLKVTEKLEGLPLLIVKIVIRLQVESSDNKFRALFYLIL